MVVPGPAQAQDALSLVLQAAGHGLQGDMALYQGTVYTGSATQLQDRDLMTGITDQSWRRAWLLFLDGGNAGQERFIQTVDGQQGLLRWGNALDNPLAAGARYVIFRDYRFAQWLAWLNETTRNIHFPLDVYLPYQDGQTLRYTMPDPIRRAGWLMDVLVGPANVAYTSPEGREARWYRVNPANIEGDLYLVLSRPISQSQQLLLRAKPPFAYEDQTPYTDLHSVLWGPAVGGQPGLPVAPRALVPPTRLFVLGTVWRSLQQKVTNMTGQPRALWQQNLERCARQYAQACGEWGIKEVGREVGYGTDWFPQSTQGWTLP